MTVTVHSSTRCLVPGKGQLWDTMLTHVHQTEPRSRAGTGQNHDLQDTSGFHVGVCVSSGCGIRGPLPKARRVGELLSAPPPSGPHSVL